MELKLVFKESRKLLSRGNDVINVIIVSNSNKIFKQSETYRNLNLF